MLCLLLRNRVLTSTLAYGTIDMSIKVLYRKTSTLFMLGSCFAHFGQLARYAEILPGQKAIIIGSANASRYQLLWDCHLHFEGTAEGKASHMLNLASHEQNFQISHTARFSAYHKPMIS